MKFFSRNLLGTFLIALVLQSASSAGEPSRFELLIDVTPNQSNYQVGEIARLSIGIEQLSDGKLLSIDRYLSRLRVTVGGKSLPLERIDRYRCLVVAPLDKAGETTVSVSLSRSPKSTKRALNRAIEKLVQNDRVEIARNLERMEDRQTKPLATKNLTLVVRQ